MANTSAELLASKLQDAISKYIERNQVSKALHEEALTSLPGGNTRTVLHTDPFPLCIKSGKGYQVTSEDGRVYTDLIGEFSAALYGHSNDKIIGAIEKAIHGSGLNIGGTTSQEKLFARQLCDRFHLERVRLANSGTEANLHALAAAKLFTGKRKVVAFSNGYHGGVLTFSGNKPAPNNVDIEDWVVVKYNDLEGAQAAIRGEGVAAVIMEGMQGAAGSIAGTPEFLYGVQKAAKDAGVVFILDEVMTSRMSTNGLAHLRGLKPDLKTLGKYLGGGLAFGAFGGREDIMAIFDPRSPGSVSHSGTFNNNTLVTRTGYVGLTEIYTPERAQAFTNDGEDLRRRLNEATKGTRVCFTGVGTLMTAHFPVDGNRDFIRADSVEEVAALRDLFWYEMLDQGFWLARRGFMALILETPPAEFDRFIEAVRHFILKYKEFVSL
ncbi:unnamed protein product [Clonostachys rosea f. rosea IK726]|uniref:Glutamate-1-semialdehyde 2,1-aminomutase n=2 Tax=Bionectria ochroleuca TaxID=29856 RepID=A0A0B7JQI8_BIOOC|nr:unnamed protein product [Clonostachys rosea f. rosea IK726]